MKKLQLLLLSFSFMSQALGQTVFWTEDFGIGCNQGTLAEDYVGANGTWTVTDLTSANNASNKWYVSATEAGLGAGACGQGCLDNGSLNNASLHLGGVDVVYMTVQIVEPDLGASYNSGGIQSFGFESTTDITAESPAIDVSGHGELFMSFNYMEGGETTNDNATLLYHDGNSWTLLEDLPKTTTCGNGQGLWTAREVSLPDPTGSTIKIAFRWVNNDDAQGADPSFAVDDIIIFDAVPTGISQKPTSNDLAIMLNKESIELNFSDIDEEILFVSGSDMLGRSVFEINGNRNSRQVIATDGLDGILILKVQTSKRTVIRKIASL